MNTNTGPSYLDKKDLDHICPTPLKWCHSPTHRNNSFSLGKTLKLKLNSTTTRPQQPGQDSESSPASGIETLFESPPVEVNRWRVDADNNHLTGKNAGFGKLGFRFQSIKHDSKWCGKSFGLRKIWLEPQAKRKITAKKTLGRIKQIWTVVSRQQLKYSPPAQIPGVRIGVVEF